MALIWSKKSSGLPIEIHSAVYPGSGNKFVGKITRMVLDMDIYKNEPKIISTNYIDNKDNWHGKWDDGVECMITNMYIWLYVSAYIGTTVGITIQGAWTYYRARIIQYFQQLAVITPYANIHVSFTASNTSGSSNNKRNFELSFERRSEQMPVLAREILPHPHSLNHITLSMYKWWLQYASGVLWWCMMCSIIYIIVLWCVVLCI